MTRSEAVMAAVMGELGRRREDIDRARDLISITFVVKIGRSGAPGVVLYRPEFSNPVRTGFSDDAM